MAAIAQKGFERITDLSSVVTLTVPSMTLEAWIQAETQNVRARFDGTDPTATSGLLIIAGAEQPTRIHVDLLASAEFIEAAASAALSVTYIG